MPTTSLYLVAALGGIAATSASPAHQLDIERSLLPVIYPPRPRHLAARQDWTGEYCPAGQHMCGNVAHKCAADGFFCCDDGIACRNDSKCTGTGHCCLPGSTVPGLGCDAGTGNPTTTDQINNLTSMDLTTSTSTDTQTSIATSTSTAISVSTATSVVTLGTSRQVLVDLDTQVQWEGTWYAAAYAYCSVWSGPSRRCVATSTGTIAKASIQFGPEVQAVAFSIAASAATRFNYQFLEVDNAISVTSAANLSISPDGSVSASAQCTWSDKLRFTKPLSLGYNAYWVTILTSPGLNIANVSEDWIQVNAIQAFASVEDMEAQAAGTVSLGQPYAGGTYTPTATKNPNQKNADPTGKSAGGGAVGSLAGPTCRAPGLVAVVLLAVALFFV